MPREGLGQHTQMTFAVLGGARDEWAMPHGPDAGMPFLFRNFADRRFGETGDVPIFFQPPTSGTGPTAPHLPVFNWDQAAAQLTRINQSWSASDGSPATVTYGFRATAPLVMPLGSDFSQFSAAQIAATEAALQLWSDVANITFVRVNPGGHTNNATMLFANYVSEPVEESAFAFYPGNTADAGDVWVNMAEPANSNLTLGTFGPQVLAHEIGHAIGIAHPADYDASDDMDPTYENDAVYWQDSRAFTVMSYFGSPPVGFNLGAFAAGPQLHDIAAAQLLYGANMTTRTGDTVYGFNSNTGRAHYTITADGQMPVFAIWDAGGVDTLDLSGYSTAVELDLRQEAFSNAGPDDAPGAMAHGNIAIARGAVIENGFGGGGGDLIIGNAAANLLRGNGGDDRLDGGAGADSLLGGDGDDVIFWDAGDDLANVQGGAGADILVFLSGPAPTSFALIAHGIEAAEGRFMDTGGNPWAMQTDRYDGAWRLDYSSVVNDDGSHTELDLDQASEFDWSTNWTRYDALARLDLNVVTYDDSSVNDLNMDQDDEFVWTSTWTRYVGGGRDITVTAFDDGSRAEFDVDQAGAFDWSTNWTQYDPLGRLDLNVVTYDDNSYAVLDIDLAGAEDWDVNWTRYDTLGRVDLNVVTYDDGAVNELILDQHDEFVWTSTWTRHVGGERDITVTVYDDGSRAEFDLDQGDAFDWATNWTQYDALGRLDLNAVNYDDGRRAVLDLDQADTFDWASMWSLYDAAGNLIAFAGVNDDGSTF